MDGQGQAQVWWDLTLHNLGKPFEEKEYKMGTQSEELELRRDLYQRGSLKFSFTSCRVPLLVDVLGEI